jgi:hypothetical protein
MHVRSLYVGGTDWEFSPIFWISVDDDNKCRPPVLCEGETKLRRVPMEAQLRDIWNEARAFHNARLTARERRHVTEVTSLEELIGKASKMNMKYRKHRLVLFLERINPFLAQLRSFSQIINSLVQSHPEIAALVWGSVSLILEASHADGHSYQ